MPGLVFVTALKTCNAGDPSEEDGKIAEEPTAKTELSKKEKRRAREAAKKAREEEAKESTQEVCCVSPQPFSLCSFSLRSHGYLVLTGVQGMP